VGHNLKIYVYDAENPEALLDAALDAIARDGSGPETLFDNVDVPVYIADADGLITYFNDACVNFAGRTPVVGQDRWCVSWKLATEDGVPLPHDQCPMAVAIRERRRVRNVAAVAERPDGGQIRFRPYPTPLIDEDGRMTGAINLLITFTRCGAGAAHARPGKTVPPACRGFR
jgi:PAS domain-containing protein